MKSGWHHLELSACMYELTSLLLAGEKVLARQRWKLPLRLYTPVLRNEGAGMISFMVYLSLLSLSSSK